MKFIIEMNANETNKSVETGALIALINVADDSAKGKNETDKQVQVESHEKPTTPTAETTLIQTEYQATHAQQTAPVQTAPAFAVVQQPAVAPTAATVFTHDQLAVAAMQLKDQGRLAELQGLLSQFGVASMVQLQPEQLSSFATALQGLGVKI